MRQPYRPVMFNMDGVEVTCRAFNIILNAIYKKFPKKYPWGSANRGDFEKLIKWDDVANCGKEYFVKARNCGHVSMAEIERGLKIKELTWIG